MGRPSSVPAWPSRELQRNPLAEPLHDTCPWREPLRAPSPLVTMAVPTGTSQGLSSFKCITFIIQKGNVV